MGPFLQAGGKITAFLPQAPMNWSALERAEHVILVIYHQDSQCLQLSVLIIRGCFEFCLNNAYVSRCICHRGVMTSLECLCNINMSLNESFTVLTEVVQKLSANANSGWHDFYGFYADRPRQNNCRNCRKMFCTSLTYIWTQAINRNGIMRQWSKWF